MKHFRQVAVFNTASLAKELRHHPELWNGRPERRAFDGTSHAATSDIWVRYNDAAKHGGDLKAMSAEHVPVWYPAWNVLPALKPIIMTLMTLVEGEMLGGVLITKIPPGGAVLPHRDSGWHVDYYDKFYVSIGSQPGAKLWCEEGGLREALSPQPGEVYLFDNRKLHWVENASAFDRVTLIVCIRTEMFGRHLE